MIRIKLIAVHAKCLKCRFERTLYFTSDIIPLEKEIKMEQIYSRFGITITLNLPVAISKLGNRKVDEQLILNRIDVGVTVPDYPNATFK